MRSVFRAPLRAQRSCCAVALIASTLLAGTATAHVTLIAPDDDGSFLVGATATIEWKPDPPHDTVGWGLWYSTVSDTGPWIPIALNLPVGENLETTVYQHDWTTPNEVHGDVWVQVLQDNVIEQDYYDVSENSFALTA